MTHTDICLFIQMWTRKHPIHNYHPTHKSLSCYDLYLICHICSHKRLISPRQRWLHADLLAPLHYRTRAHNCQPVNKKYISLFSGMWVSIKHLPHLRLKAANQSTCWLFVTATLCTNPSNPTLVGEGRKWLIQPLIQETGSYFEILWGNMPFFVSHFFPPGVGTAIWSCAVF